MAAPVPEAEVSKESQHLDQHGNSFELPMYTMKEIYDAIPPHCFKPSTTLSLAYTARDWFYCGALVYLAVNYIPMIPSIYGRALAWVAYTTVQGFVFTGLWILAHECGHNSYSNSKILNGIMGLIMHSILLVPFYTWRISHSLHHKSTGNIEKDLAFVPYTRDSWLKAKFGEKAKANMIEFAELAEDSPISNLYDVLVHQILGWPGYLMFNWSGQDYKGTKGTKISHFYLGPDSIFYKPKDLPLVILSDIGLAIVIAGLVIAGQKYGSWNVILLWGIPWLWVNNWIVAITYLHHTDAAMPHYDNKTWNFARGATATMDRDLGFLDSHFFHHVVGTHVCHHLVSNIPFYHSEEASVHIRRVMGVHYKSDPKTPFWTAFWHNQKTCKFVEETEGAEGSGVYFFRNLYNRKGETQPQDLSGRRTAGKGETLKSSMTTAMPSSKNTEARRRLSQSAHAANLPILAEA